MGSVRLVTKMQNGDLNARIGSIGGGVPTARTQYSTVPWEKRREEEGF